EERSTKLEYELFLKVRESVLSRLKEIQKLASALAHLDVLGSFAEIARLQNYCRPEIREEGVLEIREGRHPVLDQALLEERFVPNDADLDQNKQQLILITGPNMAGKSTFIRQVALLALLAHTGSFLPATSARIDLIDRIFTRIGASDDLARGQSTFMVEMLETATILQHATSRSLVVLDEIGRGTSTEDGVAIAGAVVTDLAKRVSCRTLFATHFRELSSLADTLPGVRAMQTAIEQRDGQFVFLHTILPGIAEAAFGLEIARLAGIPEPVLAHARRAVEQTTVITDLPIRQIAEPQPAYTITQPAHDLARERIIADILTLDLARTTPLDALNFLATLQDRLRAEEPLGPRVMDGNEARRPASQAD
ncbi:MAG TPA: DNA mismatch repair protein MutS, partial [Reyranella sp.]|nr:DNA mismatch repair protein MutS [Reyranella sp.]